MFWNYGEIITPGFDKKAAVCELNIKVFAGDLLQSEQAGVRGRSSLTVISCQWLHG